MVVVGLPNIIPMRVAGTASVAANQGIATATRRTSVRMVVTPGADHVVAGGVAARNLHLRLEQEKTEALAVNRVHPVSGDEPSGRPHSWQDLASPKFQHVFDASD